jgi:hypothetical protein
MSGYTFGLNILRLAIRINTNETTAVDNNIQRVRPRSNCHVSCKAFSTTRKELIVATKSAKNIKVPYITANSIVIALSIVGKSTPSIL